MAPAEQLMADIPPRPDSPAPSLNLTPRGMMGNQRLDPISHPITPDPVVMQHPPRPDSPAPGRSGEVRIHHPVPPAAESPGLSAFFRPDSPRPPGTMPSANSPSVGGRADIYPDGSMPPNGPGNVPHDLGIQIGGNTLPPHSGQDPDGFGIPPEAADAFSDPDGDDNMLEVIHLDAIYSVQKMAEVLVQGPDSEREFILFELQQLLDHCLDDTMKILLPVLCEHVPAWNVDLQNKAAKRLFDVVTFQLEPLTANMITCASFGVIQAAKGKPGVEYEELYNLWGSILVDVLPNMKWTPQEVSDVIAIIDIHADERLFTSRKVAARVLGALAQCFDRSKVEKMILPRAIHLFKDEDVEVRGTIVESLAFIGASLPIRISETEVWPRVERLLEPPEDARIRATAMRTMAHILQAQREKTKVCKLFRDLLPPVFARLSAFARKYSAEDQRLVDDDTYLLLEVVSEVFGQFLYTLSLCARKSFRKEAYKGYAGMATCNGPLIRRNCAFNLPGVAKALGDRYALELSGLCEFLAKDTDEEVRWILAAGIHQSATLLAPRGHFEKLFTAVCSLLQDENPLVRMNALGHFHELLSAFAKDGSDPASVRRLAPVFTNLTMLSEGEWRIQKSLAEQLDKCADIIPPDALVENVLPLLYRLTEQGTPLVREAAMKATAHSLRNIPSMSDRNAAINRFWNEAAKGPFWMRLALLDGGAAAMLVFSRSRFAELFAPKVLSLASDPVANVRIRLSKMLASMAPMCAAAPEYGKALDMLRRDTDVDVLANMATHHDRTVDAFRVARDTQTDDQLKFREEQEFYGIAQKSQKRNRGRLNSIRGSRGAFSRQPSLEQSTSHLSVPQSLMAGSVTGTQITAVGATPLGAVSGYDDMISSRKSQTDGAGSDDESAGPGDGLLSSLGSGHSGVHSDAKGIPSDASGSALIRGTSSIPVQKASGNRPRVFQARSKSWSGHLAPLIPRQFSVEGKRGSAKHATNGPSDSKPKAKHEPVKRKASIKRKKKRRPASVADGYSSDTTGAMMTGYRTPNQHSILGAEDLLVTNGSKDKFNITTVSEVDPTKSFLDTDILLEPSKISSNHGNISRKSTRTVSSSAMQFKSRLKPSEDAGSGASIGVVGRSMSTEGGAMRRRQRHPNLAHLATNPSEHMEGQTAGSDTDNGPSSSKFSSPWTRKAHSTKSARSARKAEKQSLRGDGNGNGGDLASHRGRSGHSRKGTSSTASSMSGASNSASNFLRSLFRKRK